MRKTISVTALSCRLNACTCVELFSVSWWRCSFKGAWNTQVVIVWLGVEERHPENAHWCDVVKLQLDCVSAPVVENLSVNRLEQI